MCGLKEFLRVQGTFLKKFLQNSLFHLKKLNLIRFIYSSSVSPVAQHLPTKEKALKPFRQATLATFPFRDGLLLAILCLVPKYRDFVTVFY